MQKVIDISFTLNLSEFSQNKKNRFPQKLSSIIHGLLTKWTFVSPRDGQPFVHFFQEGQMTAGTRRSESSTLPSGVERAFLFGRLVFRLPHTPMLKTDGPTHR
ncbi:hypothetical protein CDAR_534551 [Caerostris darwini]|uniref:Uncharacterized protein n=1 Tax=Caerostris darwini TaxID=1538125 RepID=A0AAV4MI46_9ARAC|nr:hypothetical protein CDAR_534551 [Caerostris darwini]